MNRQQLLEYMEEKSALVDNRLEEFISREDCVQNLHDGIIYSLGLDIGERRKRGKRLRPVLCLLTCELLGGDKEAALPFAIAIELMHNYCLIHDDIEDGDSYRRGRQAVWKKFGLAHGINIGDYIHTRLYGLLVGAGEMTKEVHKTGKLLQLMAETLRHTHIGQAMDMNARQRKDLSQEEYMQIVREKTGYYLAAPLLGGAMVADADEQTLNALRRYGQYIGPMFQIVDDVIDLTEGKGREDRGSDIREGKRSFLVVYTQSQASTAEKRQLFAILDKPRSKTTKRDLNWVVGLFNKYQAIEKAQEFCKELNARSKEVIGDVVPRLRKALITVSDFLLERKF